ncbi:MAG: SUMF1/EgtB/PvdO family nonheme iron enzyme [SAR324 cluster bacterium]|nr:SUMF1/EgtB/PvdO family nonheme iron enzyme [SAR324 cluster bacterium]
MKQLFCLCFAGLLLWPNVIFPQELFQKMVKEFGEQSVKEFVGFVAKNERYPLLHIVTQLRFRIFQAYLGIKQQKDTKACSIRRNSTDFRLNQLVLDTLRREDFPVQGIKKLEPFEKISFKTKAELETTVIAAVGKNLFAQYQDRIFEHARNYSISSNQLPFCQRYDQTIEAAKKGMVDLDGFEKIYFKLEPLLLRELEIQQAQVPMRRWIQNKINCFDQKTRCGRDERGVISRVTNDWEPNIIRLYKHLLGNLEKKLFPEEGNIASINDDVIESPCSFSGDIGNVTIRDGMVLIPEGVFVMGNDNGRSDEKKAHGVFLDSFWIDRCEVSNLDYLKYVITDSTLRKSTFQRHFHDGDYLQDWNGDLKPPNNRDHYPVVYVSWNAARYYCQHIGKRLPSEAEWEKASRAGEFAEYPLNDVTKLVNYAWYNENSEGRPRLSADRLPNKFQLFDMQGNVWEWIYDWYGPYPQKRVENPVGPPTGKYKVLRGGSWKSSSYHLRSTMRGDDSPVNTSDDVGFRCASSEPPPKKSLRN